MTNYQPGDLILVGNPFVGSAATKDRPALVILDTGDNDLVVARVTTRIHSTPQDVEITDWQAAGLLALSYVRLHKLATLEKNLVRRHLGHLTPGDQQKVSDVMHQTYGTW
jgi:mRNA interferase MazF